MELVAVMEGVPVLVTDAEGVVVPVGDGLNEELGDLERDSLLEMLGEIVFVWVPEALAEELAVVLPEALPDLVTDSLRERVDDELSVTVAVTDAEGVAEGLSEVLLV